MTNKKVGGQKENTNALKHGKYSKHNLLFKNRKTGAQFGNKNTIKKGIWANGFLNENEAKLFSYMKKNIQQKCSSDILTSNLALNLIKFFRACEYGTYQDFFCLSSSFTKSMKKINKHIKNNAPLSSEEKITMEIFNFC